MRETSAASRSVSPLRSDCSTAAKSSAPSISRCGKTSWKIGSCGTLDQLINWSIT